MRIYSLSCFQNFHCLASACLDTCCQAWEVMLDAETCERYRTMPGALGEHLRAEIREENGTYFFQLRGGECPFLDADRLCTIQRQAGAESLSVNCAAYPRFTEIYGGDRECCLALSCPEAARLLLQNAAPLQIVTAQDDAPPALNTLDPQRYLALRRGRAAAIAIVQDRTMPLEQRLATLLAHTSQLQRALRRRKCEVAEPQAVPCCADAAVRRRIAARTVRLFQTMELLREDWAAALRKTDQPQAAPEWQYEHIVVYLLFRYYLKAVEDNKLLPRVRGIVLCYLLLRQMTDLSGILHVFSRELEHSEQNLARLFSAAGGWRFSRLMDALAW